MTNTNTNLSTNPYKGARDFYPEDLRLRDYIFETWRRACYSYGYEEYDAPILEPVEIFTAKSGDELVNQQSYRFSDRGGREVMMRPEMTPSVSRMIASRRQELTLPIRWFSIPNCWRYERPQKGRGREFYQLNVDMFGVSDSQAEIEMLQMINSIMQGFGAKQSHYQIKVNSRKLINKILDDWLGLDEVEQKTISKLIDRMHKMPRSEFEALLDAAIPPSLRENGATDKLIGVLNTTDIDDLPDIIRQTETVSSVKSIIKAANSLGVDNIKFDITMIRGLDYYTDFVFEVFDTDPDNNRAMFGGGRYDGLVSLFGADPIPTIGFGMSDVMLLEFLKGHDLLPTPAHRTELIIIPIGDTASPCHDIAQQMREMNVNVAIDLTKRKIDKQLKAAIRSGVNYVLFVGDQEIEQEQYKLKNLARETEDLHSIQRIVSIVKDRRNNIN